MDIKNKNLYYIGGIVRDELLGKESFDIDVTYVGNAIEYAKTLTNTEILQINEPFGTVRVKSDGCEIDIASTRSEVYPQKGHLPVVKDIGCSLKEDILRRDFTINALAKSTLTGEIIDYTTGLDDIKNKTLRVLHDDSFIDDPTRIIRGLKFSVRFGFKYDEHTKMLQQDYLKNINYDMSYKRLKKELVETFNLNSLKAFDIFVKEGLYKLIAPQNFILPKVNIEELVKIYKPSCIWIVYVGLLPDISSLPLTKIEKKIVDDYNSIKDKSLAGDAEIYQAFNGLNLETVLMYAAVKDIVPARRYLDYLKDIKLEITGEDLKSLGVKPSGKYQECFNFILGKKFKNPALDKAQEIQLAKEFFGLT